MDYQFSFSGVGTPQLARLVYGIEKQFSGHGLGHFALGFQAQGAANGNAGGASGDSSDSSNSGSPPPKIGRDSALYLCPYTKHPVDPNSHCILVAIVAAGKVPSPAHEALELGLIGLVALVAAYAGTALAGRARR